MATQAIFLLAAGFAGLASASTATTAILHQPTDAASQARIFNFTLADGQPNICSLNCDGRAVSQAQEDLSPVPERLLNGRVVSLHVSDADVMAWASLQLATPGDTVWLERSWDAIGQAKKTTTELGNNEVANGKKAAQTKMYNLADPDDHRRGIVRACADAGGDQACTQWAYQDACELSGICDGAATPADATGYFPVPATDLDGRALELHMDDNRMAWAVIRAAQVGDEAWIERAWDAAEMTQVDSLGRLAVPTGGAQAVTALFATRDVKLLLYGGAVRACGQAGTSGSTCTSWARPDDNRAADGVDALVFDYEVYTAWWLSSWWNSAEAIHTVIDYMRYSNDTQYMWMVERTFTINRLAYPADVKSTDPLPGDFLSRAIDDTLWWALAWTAAYELTGNTTYLDEATLIADSDASYYDNSTCGGGIWWDAERTYKNAVTNGQYVTLLAQLHTLIDGDTEYLQRAQTAWDWYVNSGMINAQGFVNDGLTDDCQNNNDTVWTYNQGMGIGAGVWIWHATGEKSALQQARVLADAAIAEGLLTVKGILTEECDPTGSCDDNEKQFKGIFMRYLGNLADATGQAKYKTYVRKQANSIWNRNRDSLNRFGGHWTGSEPNAYDWRTQASALGALIAAVEIGS